MLGVGGFSVDGMKRKILASYCYDTEGSGNTESIAESDFTYIFIHRFVIKGISEDSSIQDIIAGSAPFAFIMVLEIALLCFFPGIATWLPSVLK